MANTNIDELSTLPENISDLPGMSTWEEHNYAEIGGQRYSFKQLDEQVKNPDGSDTGFTVKQAIRPTGRPIYEMPDGSMTRDLPSSTISIDKNTGNINIVAPKEITDRESFKSIFNQSDLEQISSLYKRNPDVKIPNPFNDADEDKDITIPELIDKYQKAMDEYSDTVKDEMSQRTKIRSSGSAGRNDIADRLTEQDFITMWSSPYQDQAKGDSLLAIPKSLAPVFNNVKGYDAESGYISKDDFLDNFWHLEKTNDETIESMYQATKDYFKYDDFSDTDEYARMAAFDNFINNRSPNTDFWNGARVNLMALGSGVLSGIGNVGTAIGNITEGVYNAIGQFDEGDPMYADNWKNLEETIHEEFSDPTLEHVGHLTSGGNAVFGLAEFGTEIAANIAIGNAVGGAVKGVATSAVTGAVDAFSTAKNATEVGTMAAEAAIVPGESLTIGGKLAIGAEAMLDTAGLAKAGNLVKSAVNIKKATAAAGTMADLAAQSVVDASLTNPELFRNIIENGVRNDEESAYLLEQAAWNVGGWMGALGIGKIAKEFGKTAAGKAMNAAGSKFINKAPVWVSDLNNRAHALFLGDDWIEKIKNPKKKAARAANESITEARRAVAKAKGTEEITDAVNKLRKVQNAVDALQRAGSDAVSEYTNKFINATLSGKEDEINELASKIISLEKKSDVLTKAPKKLKANDVVRVFSKETANYIASRKQIELLENIKKITGGLTKAQDDGYQALVKMADKSAEAMGSELTKLADKYVKTEQGWWQEFNRIRMDQGLLNKAEIDELKESGLWGKDGELYARTQRVAEDPTYLHVRVDGQTVRKNITLVDNYKWGSERDFADPMISRYEAMMQAGIERNSKQYFDAMKNIPGIKSKTVVSAAETERVRQVKKFRTTFEKSIERSTKTAIPEIFSKNGIMRNAAKMDFWDVKKLAAESAMESAAGKKANAYTNKIRVTNRMASNSAMSMPDNAIEDFLAVNGYSANLVTRENFADFIDSLPIDTKNLIVSRIKEANAGAIAADEKLAELQKGLPKIRTSDYTALTGIQKKDAPEWIKPYLSSDGNRMDTVAKKLSKNPEFKTEGDLNATLEVYEQILGRKASDAAELTYDNWKKALDFSAETYGDDFATLVNRSNLVNNDKLLKHDTIRAFTEEQERARLIAEKSTIYKDKVEYFNKFSSEEGKAYGDAIVDAINKNIDEGLDSFMETAVSDPNSARVLDALVEESGAIDKAAAKDYLLLSQLKKESKSVKEAYQKEIKQQLKSAAKNPNNEFIKGREDEISKKIDEMFEDRLDDRFNNARQALLDQGGKAADLVDKKYMYKQISDLDREITKQSGKADVIAYQNALGEIEYIETSPLVAGLYSFRPGQEDMGKFWRAMNISSKMFRLGTTGLNIKSMVNQMFRDFGNAWLAGGMWNSFKGASNRLTAEFGESLVEAIQRSDPEAYQSILKIADETGEDLASAAVRQVEERANLLAKSSTETEYYKRAIDGRHQIYSVKKGGAIEATDNLINKATDKLGTLNETREKYLRKSVYMNGFYDALQKGQTYDDAIQTAEFLANNATTNFSRQLVHLNKLQGTIPYLGAAINGTRSFWRIFSIDPVGVMSRLVGGAVIPMMAITSHNMIDPDNRKKYEQFAEYEKDENFIVGVGGEFVKVPIPQEIAPILAPFRQMVEGFNGSDQHDFWELAANDVLGFSPVDVSGFYSLDQNDLTHDLTFWDRMNEGFSKLIAQVSPPPIKSAIMALTGKDPYTGKKIDTRYAYWDEESGQVEIMDSSQSSFAHLVAGAFGGSAQLAEKIISNIFGQTGLDVLDIVTSSGQAIATGGKDGDLFELPERILSEATSPMSVADYDRTNQKFNQGIRELYDMKKSIIDDEQGEYRKLTQQINLEKNPEKKSKLINERKSLLQPWQKSVGDFVVKFKERYGEESFDRFRLGSVISLLNPVSQEAGLNAADTERQQQDYYSGMNEARQTLVEMGANKTGDTSMLGYMYRDKNTGKIGVKYNTPLEILAAQDAWYKKSDISVANMTVLANEAGLKDKYKAFKSQRDAIYNKTKLSKNDYAKVNELEVAWNAEVMKTFAPYVNRVGPEVAINNEDSMNFLRKYIKVPSDFKRDKRGRYVTDKSLSRKMTDESSGADASSADAYIENYIKQLWRINDTGWYNGKNYSKRKTLGVK